MPETSQRTSVSVKGILNMGVDSNGNQKTKSLSIGKLSNTGYNDTGALAVIDALKPCLARNFITGNNCQKTEKFDVDTASA